MNCILKEAPTMKNKFLWGSATAAYQCEGAWQEGNKSLSNWDAFSHDLSRNKKGVTGDIASDFYHRFEEDIKLLAECNQNSFRFSFSWSRIIDSGTGKRNPEGIKFYNRLLDTLDKYHIEPFFTLYHYDLPNNLYEKGGWENRDTVYAFNEYAKVIFEEFGSRIKYWTTINEPNYETFCCYGRGNYPPNVQDLGRRWRAMYHLLLGSALAIKTFKDMKIEGQIGLVSDSYSIETLVNNQDYEDAKHWADYFYNRSVNDVCVKGTYDEEFVNKLKNDGYPTEYIKESDLDIFKNGVVDFLGVNAYDRTLVKPYTCGETQLSTNNSGDGKTKNVTIVKNWFEADEDINTPKNAWGCEIYPKAIYNLLKQLKELYPKLPIIITENGLGYYDTLENGQIHDQYRSEYLEGNLKWIEQAMHEGCDVRGYFVWSTMDLYSWINGYQKRYGLVYVDYENNLKRIPKDSYFWYQKYIKERGNEYEQDQ